MFGSSIIKAAAVGIIAGLIKQLDDLANAIKLGDQKTALGIVAEMKSALEKVKPWLARSDDAP